jgi:hypothetical protein
MKFQKLSHALRRKLIRRIFIIAAVLSIYPASVLTFTYIHVFKSDFEGGRHGKLDAYRHTLASATISYTIGEWAVSFATNIMEFGSKESNKMDRHNNRLGGKIGSTVQSFSELEPAVRKSIEGGTVMSSDPDQSTWLPPEKWSHARMW